MKAKAEPGRAPVRSATGTTPVTVVDSRAQETVADLNPRLSPSRPPSTLRQTDLGEYVLQEEIGRGGMGVVYRARQKELDRMVAVKMILAGQMASQQMRDLFLAEARAAARVRYPNIVGVYEVGEAHGWHFIAMELVEGRSLEKMIGITPLPVMEAARICRDVARAVSYLHSKKIVHRDLKPSNILMDQDGHPYVTDFGLAKVYETESGQTLSGLLAGTPSYMSPEQAAGRHHEVGFASDVYSAGAVLYHMLTGQPPFQGETPQQTIVRVLRHDTLPPRRLRHEIPPPLELVCMKCLERDQARRYADAAALAEDLSRFVEGEPVEARPASPWRRLVKWARREPALAAHLVALAAFYLIECIWRYGPVWSGLEFHRAATGIVPLWAIGSIFCQRRLRREDRSCTPRLLWACMDILFATALLLLNDGGVMSPLVALYPLLIAASGLWCRTRIVWFITGASMLSYTLLWGFTALNEPNLEIIAGTPYVFLLSLAILGLVVALQTRRMRHLLHALCEAA